MTFEACRAISADHPSLPGHFPDRPLVPGVVILDEVLTALVEWRKDCQLAGIRAVKSCASEAGTAIHDMSLRGS